MKTNKDNKSEPKKRGRPPGPFKPKAKAYPQKKYIKIKRFVTEYLVDLNGLRAYQRCGYGTGNDSSDAVASGKLLNRPNVIQLIAEAEVERTQNVEITQEKVLHELSLLAFANLRDISTWDGNNFVLRSFAELTRDQTAIISGMKIMPKPFGGIDLEFKTPTASEKRTALVDLGKHLGLFWEADKQVNPIEAAQKIRQALKEQDERTASKE